MGHALTIALHSIDEHHQEEEEEATSITQFNEEVVYSYLFLEHLHVNCKDILNLHKHALYNQTGNYFITESNKVRTKNGNEHCPTSKFRDEICSLKDDVG